MTNHTITYPKEPDKLLEMVLADTRHFADDNGLNFDEHELRSRDLYLEDRRIRNAAAANCSMNLKLQFNARVVPPTLNSEFIIPDVYGQGNTVSAI